jgi:hypothetical protein
MKMSKEKSKKIRNIRASRHNNKTRNSSSLPPSLPVLTPSLLVNAQQLLVSAMSRLDEQSFLSSSLPLIWILQGGTKA